MCGCEKLKNVVHWFWCEVFVVVAVLTGKYGERSDMCLVVDD